MRLNFTVDRVGASGGLCSFPLGLVQNFDYQIAIVSNN